MKLNSFSTITFLLCLVLLFSNCNDKKVYTDKIYIKPEIVRDPAINFLSPEESMKTMFLPEGYHVELVASEPMVNEPVAMAWDADGKLYVAEMLTYMQDADGTNEQKPWSRVSVLEDIDGDGKMDKSTVFIDSLVLPRIILPLDDRVIIGETYNRNMWSYRDTNGDNVADEKILLLENKVIEKSNLEHQSGSLMWSIDNYMYLSMGAIRYRYTRGKIETDTLSDAPSGQWGLTEDENGQPYYSRAGGEIAALGFQQHPSYGALEMDDNWELDFEQPWPVTGTPDVQGGLQRLREDGTLNHFTAACGQSIFLGDKLPAYGDLFIPEPVGRLIRRARVNNIGGKKVLSNVYDKTEFLAATDMNFRPVDTKTGPDGCLYVLDMYRGIIQEGNWTRKGSYLRGVVERKGFDKNIGKGRIYRIVHNEMKPAKREKLLNKSSKELLKYLSHPNAWYRMNAQKLIVLRRDTEVISKLEDMVRGDEPFFGNLFSNADFALGRLHALWTLEGLDAISEDLVIEKMKDADPRLRRAALRISERYLKKGNKKVFAQIETMQNDTDKEVLIQIELSLRSYKDKEAKNKIINQIMASNIGNEVITFTGEESIKEVPLEIELLKQKYILENSNLRSRIIDGYNIYKGLCIACHGDKGQGIEGVAPPLVGSQRVKGDWQVPFKILLDGLTGPIDGKNYAGVMVGMKQQDNKWMSDVLTYIRVHFNDAPGVGPGQMENVRKEVKDRNNYWTLDELIKKKDKKKNK